jgi:hypothetical protein
MLRGQHIRTEHQGRYVYEIFVGGSGSRWGWEIVRISEISAAVVHAWVIEEGQARSRAKAIDAARATCRKIMERYRVLDGEHAMLARGIHSHH